MPILEYCHIRNCNIHYRRPPLTSYMCVEAIYGLFYALKSRGIVKSFPNGEVCEVKCMMGNFDIRTVIHHALASPEQPF